MINSILVRAGLRARILMTVGLISVLLMIVLSWGMLYSWRRSILRQEKVNVTAVSRAFSVTVIDALILADQGLEQPESSLDNYVDLFVAQNERLRATTVLGPDGELFARSWDSRDPPWVTGPLDALLAVEEPTTTITSTAGGEWVLEHVLPLRTGERDWGVLVLAIEADSIRRQIRNAFFQLAVFSIAVSLVMITILWSMLSRILGSLNTLVSAMDTLDINTTDVPALPYRHDEVGILYRQFHRMKRRVEQSRRELIAAQHQVWHAERLAAIGRLASGLAHEINNPINGIRNCVYEIRREPENREQTLEYLEMMDEGLSHASNVIEKLLGFARKQQSGWGAVDLNDVAASVLRMTAFDLERKRIDLQPTLRPDLPAVHADDQLMQEVVMNLLLNAVDASDEGGVIRVLTDHEDGRVTISVRDDGPGVAPDVRDRIFEPFFTTKGAGRGTGLGLSISLGIVQAHGGDIEARSEPGRGASFTVSLPIAEAEPTEDGGR